MLVNGLAFLVVGRLYWGWYYLLALAHFTRGGPDATVAGRAPLVYGVFGAVCMTALASDHYRTARREKRRPYSREFHSVMEAIQGVLP
jgi:hypothetical protein